jgi:hypothetical protein
MTPAPEPSSWFSSQYTNSVELPAEPFPSQEPAQGDFLPIFASVESSWFTKPSFTPDRREPDPDPAWSSSGAPSWPSQEETSWPSQGDVTPAPLPTRAARAPQDDAGPMTPSRAPVEWSSPADSGWQAAGAVREPALGGTTSSGLPKRTPKANLVPGSAAPAPAPMPAPPVSPDRLRSRLSSYQQGVRKGRAELEED